MASTPPTPTGNRNDPAPAPAGSSLAGRVVGKVTGSFIDAVLSNMWNAALYSLPPLLGYVALWQTEVVPGPRELVERVTRPGGTAPVAVRPLGIEAVKALGDGVEGAKARAIQVRVTGKLRAMPETFAGVRVQYALGPIRSGRGATSATSVRWALARPGTDWLVCPEVPIAFTSDRALAEEVAKQINNSLLASETGGKLQCG